MRGSASSATGVRNVTSSTGSPPSTSARASGAACSSGRSPAPARPAPGAALRPGGGRSIGVQAHACPAWRRTCAPHRGAEQAGLGMGGDADRHRFELGGKPPLEQEAFAERAGAQERDEARRPCRRRSPAGARAMDQRGVARDAAQHRAEARERAARGDVVAGERAATICAGSRSAPGRPVSTLASPRSTASMCARPRRTARARWSCGRNARPCQRAICLPRRRSARKVTWPPSVSITRQPAPAHRPGGPRPAPCPGRSRSPGLAAAERRPEQCVRSPASSAGTAHATAPKSLRCAARPGPAPAAARGG